MVVGQSVRIAVYRAIYTEANAKLLLQAKMLGGPINYLAPEEAAIMESAQARPRPGHGPDRTWEMWAADAANRNADAAPQRRIAPQDFPQRPLFPARRIGA